MFTYTQVVWIIDGYLSYIRVDKVSQKFAFQLTVNAEFGVVPAFVDHQHGDQQEGARKHSQTHGH